MTSGRKAYEDLGREIETLRARTAAQSRRLAGFSAELEQAQAGEAREAARLARLRLGELVGQQADDRFGSAEREAIAQMARRDQAMQEGEAGIASSEQTQRELEAQRDRVLAALEQVHERFQHEHAAVAERCRAEPDWQALDQRAERLAGQAELSRSKAEQAEADRVAKGQPYETDALFIYLWRRQYGSAGYRARALTRALDGWVAGLIGYRDAARNYRLLLALPEQLRRHADRVQTEAEQARAALEALERQALEQAGVLTLGDQVEQLQSQVETLATRLEDEERRHAALLAERAALAEGEDEYTRAALAILAEAIADAPSRQLQQAAQATPGAEDDAIVASIERSREQHERLSRDLVDGKLEHERDLAALARLEELRRRFREQRFDSPDSELESGLDWSAVLGGLLRGAVESARVWERVQRHQRFRTPRIPRASTGSGAGRARAPFGGNLGKGGGFGSSGFKTGGGFGGGGGNRSGGGF